MLIVGFQMDWLLKGESFKFSTFTVSIFIQSLCNDHVLFLG